MNDKKFTEAELEQAIITLFTEQNFEYLSGDSIHRKFNEILLLDDLKGYLARRYASAKLSPLEIDRIVNRLNLISATPLYKANRETFRLVNEGFDLVRDDFTSIALHIDYIDFDKPENNSFKIVNQYTVQGEDVRRPDLLLFINGIPIAIFEFKSAIKEDATIYDAWKQITVRYTRDIPNLMRYTFLSVISDGANTRMGSIFTPYEFYYAWNKINDDEKVSDGIRALITLIKGAFAKERVLQILRDFIFYPDDSTENKAIICRYPQFFGAQKMFASIKTHLRPNGNGKGGTYFGATGCGKTYTMLFLARLLTQRDNAVFHNPTILILVDREDLDTQTSEIFVTAKKFLHENDVKSIENRTDLEKTLRDRPSGGVYITTIQKFCEDTGLLSTRENIICISDEAHRTQTGTDMKLKYSSDGVHTSYGFAHYLRASLPCAVYCGFTGTPIDETISVFGDIVDSYTMKESTDDGITAKIAYEPRLARVILSDEEAKAIEQYYQQCSVEGASDEQIAKSKKAMSAMAVILGHPERIHKLANDIIEHYEKLCTEKPKIVQKAMIVCANRNLAFKVLKEIISIRPEWGEPRKADPELETNLSKELLDKLLPLPKINLVATQGVNDEKELYDLCGSKEYRKTLDKQFKNINSNFKIAVVVDMWITGFDVPPLAVMYIDKPIQRHTLIQTISRVNRVFDGKDKGLIVDYIGIKNNMLEALKQYASRQDSPVEDIKESLDIFSNYLALIDSLMTGFDSKRFFSNSPLERLYCLNDAAEYVQSSKDRQIRFMNLSHILKNAYEICAPTGELIYKDLLRAQFYLAIRSIIYKQTKGNAPDAEIMNHVVEKMVCEAISCTGIENIVGENKSIDLFNTEFLSELDKIKLPISKFNALLKLLQHAIKDYYKTNKVKAQEFDAMLRRVIEDYNKRDDLTFTSAVLEDFVNGLSDRLLEILKNLEEDKTSFKRLGITYEEKVFYDILVRVRDTHEFSYADEKCLMLAGKIKELVDDKTQYADWASREDIKSQLNMALTILLYNNGYPPTWNKEVFDKVMEQYG